MKKIFKRMISTLLVIALLFGAGITEPLTGKDIDSPFDVEANAFTIGSLLLLSGTLIATGVGLDAYKSTVDTTTKTNVSTNEWIYMTTVKNLYRSYVSVIINDGSVGSTVNISFERKDGSNWRKVKKFGITYDYLDFKIDSDKRIKSNSGENSFRLKDGEETYRIKVTSGNYSNITIMAQNAVINEANSSTPTYNTVINAWKEILSPSITTSAITYNSAAYKENPEKATASISQFNFGKINVDNLTGNAVKLSSSISNGGGLRISDYGMLLKETSGSGTHSDKKGSTSSKSFSYSSSISNLKPNTTYTGTTFANTAYGTFLGETITFKTPLIKPPKAKISSAKAIDYRNNTETNSTDMGVGDNVSIKWNKADYADYYTISINGVEDKTKIKGTSKVLSFDEAGTKTIKVRAHNSVGSGEWSDAVTVTVHPDVNITFYKDGNIYQSQTLTWGHDFETLPEIPVKKGAAFKGWYNVEGTSAVSFKNIKSDLAAHATYNVNKYTVKFVGPDGTLLSEQVVEHGKAAVVPSEEEVKKVVKSDRVFIGWNKDFSCIVENTTVIAVTDAKNQDIPVEITDVSAVRYKKNYIVTCNVNNLTRAEVENGRIVVALKTAQGKLVTTTESAAYFLEANYTDVNGNLITRSENIKVTVPIYEADKALNASYAEVYAIRDYQSLVPISSMVEVAVVEKEIWSEPTTENRTSDYADEDWDSWTEYRSRELMQTNTNSITERDKLVSEEKWTYDETATTSYKDKNSGTWTTKKPTSGKVNVDYAEKTVTDKKATTVYKYRTYRYWNAGAGAYYYSYGRGWADSMGYSGKWLYLETSSALKKIGDADGYYQYDNSNDNHIWYSNGTDKKTNPKVSVAAVTHKEYRVFDTVYTYYLNKWPEEFSEWSKNPVTETKLVDVETREVYIYREKDGLERNEDNLGEQRTDSFLFDMLGEEFVGKQVILAIYKVNEASDWTLEHIDQTVVNEDGTYEFDAYKLREDLSDKTGDLTVVLGIEGSEKPIYIDTIEAPKPEYTVTYIDSLTGDKIPSSYEEDGPYYCYKRYHYVIEAATGDYHVMYTASKKDDGDPTTHGEWEYMVTKEPLELGGTMIDGTQYYYDTVDNYKWYQADCNIAEGLEYTEYIINRLYNYEQTVIEHGDAVPPEAPIHEGYTFSHWDMRSSDIIGDTVINAVYTPNEYTVVWIDYVQEKYEVETYKHGQNLVQPYGLTDTDEMISTGWDSYVSGTVVPVTSNIVITAQYDYKTFTVDFLDFDGNVISSQNVRYGETPEFPEFDYEGEEDLIFFGFTSEEEYAIEDEELLETASVELTDVSSSEEGVEAEGEQSDYIMVESYEVYNNCQIVPKFEYIETTEMPTVDVKTGTYSTARTVTIDCATENASIFYTLDGSDPATSETTIESSVPATITVSDSCQLRYYASAFNMNASAEGSEWYAINDGSETYKYIVKFAAYDDSNVVYTGIVEKGSLIDEELISEVDGYTFSGAYKNINVETDSETGEMTNVTYSDKWNFATDTVTADTTLYLDYTINTYTVEFVDYDGRILGCTQTIEYGSNATAPETPERDGYVFTGWDTDAYLDVLENLTVNAVYVPEDEYVTIDLNRSNYTMMSGNSYTLTATTGGNVENPEIIWASSDENVAVVDDNGVVTATGKGSADIYAIVIDNGETATCKINVVGNPSDELTLVGKSHLAVDDYGYIRGFTVSTNAETQEHYAESVAEVKTQFLNNELVFTDINGNVLSDDDYVGTGTVIKVMDGDKELDSIIVVVSGDMDGDGYVTNRDASRISRYLVDKESPTEVQICAMDVNGDGYVNNRDASVVSRYLVGKEAI